MKAKSFILLQLIRFRDSARWLILSPQNEKGEQIFYGVPLQGAETLATDLLSIILVEDHALVLDLDFSPLCLRLPLQ